MKDEKSQKILQDRASIFAKPEVVVKETQQESLLIFYVNKEKYAVEYKYIKRVLLDQNITPIPHAPVELRGVCYYEGNVLSVMSAATLFYGKPNMAELSLVLLNQGEHTLGLSVGDIIGQEYYDESIELVQFATERASRQKMISGIYKKEFSLINVPALFKMFEQLNLKEWKGVKHG